MIPYKNREINLNKPVRIYRNLNKSGMWFSVVQGGLTVAHTQFLFLRDCTFKINEKTRQRVIRDKQKEFHAYIEGYIIDKVDTHYSAYQIIYNPYTSDSFVYLKDPAISVRTAKYVLLNTTGVHGFIINN